VTSIIKGEMTYGLLARLFPASVIPICEDDSASRVVLNLWHDYKSCWC
jgi:hypothetical protein